jgi:hypothetical protein
MTSTRQIAPRKRDKKKRPRLTERKVIEVLIGQGAIIPCGICRLAFAPEDVAYIERDHRLCEHAIPDEDLEEKFVDLSWQRYVHGRLDPKHSCHLDKTASDRKIKAKHDRINGLTGNGPKAKIRSRNTLTKEYRDQVKAYMEGRG